VAAYPPTSSRSTKRRTAEPGLHPRDLLRDASSSRRHAPTAQVSWPSERRPALQRAMADGFPGRRCGPGSATSGAASKQAAPRLSVGRADTHSRHQHAWMFLYSGGRRERSVPGHDSAGHFGCALQAGVGGSSPPSSTWENDPGWIIKRPFDTSWQSFTAGSGFGACREDGQEWQPAVVGRTVRLSARESPERSGGRHGAYRSYT
jgi:hypothetical protein